MSTEKENKINPDSTDAEQDTHQHEELEAEKVLDDDLRYAEEAIEQAFIETEQENKAKAEKRLAVNKEKKVTSENMTLEEDTKVDEGLPCLNCKTPLKGPYCYECGQPERHFIRFFPRVLWDMINEAFDLDSKIFRTLMPLMFRPGRLTMEYIAGRRASYINPLRMYIVRESGFLLGLAIGKSIRD